MPKVSVITPVYNGAQYLAIALDSLLAQTFADWELIVVDDGSTDATPLVLEHYNDPRITRVRQANAGEAAARNNGLSRATGEYVAFLDSDDLYLPNALADMTAYMDAHPEYGVLFCDGHVCDENGNVMTRLTEHRPGIYTGDVLEALMLDAAVVTVPICTLTRRSAITSSRAQFDRNLVIGPDWDFWIQLARRVHFGYLDKLTCMYRVHLSNITRLSGQKRRVDDLVYGRMKVLNSDWFGDLPVATRYRFLYHLIVELLAGQTDRQEALLESPQTRAIPLREQAELWRHTGIDYLRKQAQGNFAVMCLHEAAQRWPGDRKSRMVLTLAKWQLFRALMPRALHGWQRVHRWFSHARAVGKTSPKAVPAGLRPVGE
jgi:prepilin-type processing-associated H-X9-DG protein